MDHLWIWKLIKNIQNRLELSVQLIKVKSHSNNHFNDKADLLAKKKTDKVPLSINLNNIPEILMHFEYDTCIMDISIKSLITNTLQA